MYGPASGTPTSSSSAARLQANNNNEHQQQFGGTAGMSNLSKPSGTAPNVPPSGAAAAAATTTTAADNKLQLHSNFAAPTSRLRLNMPSLALPMHSSKPQSESGEGGGQGGATNNQQQSTKLFDTIVVPPARTSNTLQDVAANIREKLHIPTNLGFRALQLAIAEQQAKRKKKAAKKGPKLPFKQMVKEAALRQYRRWFKPAELVFYLGQRESAAFPFRLDDNKSTYTYAWRELFHVYAGIVGIAFGIGWWWATQSPLMPLRPDQNFDTVTLTAFLPFLSVVLSLWMIMGEIIPQRLVIDTSDHTVHLYRFGLHTCAARYETSFVRLRRALGSSDELDFNLVFGARNFPECFLSGKTKNARVMRTLGRNLAKHLHVNYFDFSDLSIFHIPRMPHFAADPDWTQEMLCILQIMKRRQQELDEVRNGPPPEQPLSSSLCHNNAAAGGGGRNSNLEAILPASSVCLNIHAAHIEPETVESPITPSQAAIDGGVTAVDVETASAVPLKCSIKHRPQALSQPRHTATLIKRPIAWTHPMLPEGVDSRPNVKDSLESLSKMMLSSEDSKSNADVESGKALR